MNVFTNSIINIIYSLFNSIMPENVKMLFVLVSALTYIFGMILSYFHYRQKIEHPLLYVIPVIRIFVILFRDVENKKQEFYQKACGTLLLVASLDLYFASMNEDIILNAFAIGAVLLALAELFGAILNYHLLCEADGIKMKDRNSFNGIMLYFFPFLYLFFTLPDEYKSKSIRQKISALLAIIVFIETFVSVPAVEVKAATLSEKIGCDVCDHSSNIITYRMESNYFNVQTNQEIYDSMIGITCPECEIIHVVDTDADFGFRFEGDGNTCWTPYEDGCAFIDFSRIDSNESGYAPFKFRVSTDGILVVEKSFKDGSWSFRCDGFYSAPIKEYYGDLEMTPILVKLYPSGNDVYVKLADQNFRYDTSGASICKPKNFTYSCFSNANNQTGSKSYVVDNTSNQDYTNLNGNNVNTNSNGEERISIGNVFKDIDWGKTAKDSLVKSLGAVGVGIGLAALASISTPITIGIAAIGTVSAIVYGACTVSRIMTVAKSDDMSIEAKEYAWAGLASDLMSDGVAIVAGSVAYSYAKPKFTAIKTRKTLLSEEVIFDVNNHLGNGTFTQNDGINGGHDKNCFMDIVNSNNLKIVDENPSSINGVSIIRYQIPRKDGSGLYKSKVYTKTVFDSKIISQDEFLNAGLEAVDNYISSCNGKITDGLHSATDSSNIKWEFAIRKGQLKTIYPKE